MNNEFKELFEFLQKKMIGNGLGDIHEELMERLDQSGGFLDYKSLILEYLKGLKLVMSLYSPDLTNKTIKKLNNKVKFPDDKRFEEIAIVIDDAKLIQLKEYGELHELVNKLLQLELLVGAYEPGRTPPSSTSISL